MVHQCTFSVLCQQLWVDLSAFMVFCGLTILYCRIPIVDMVELPPYSRNDPNNDARDSQLAQEVQDEELARTLDEQEDRDRKIAIEQQDEELAWHLQEKEKQLAKKRQRDEMMRLQQQQGHQQPPIAFHPQPHAQQQPIQSRRQSQKTQPVGESHALPPRASSQPQFTTNQSTTTTTQVPSQQPNHAVDRSVPTRATPSSVPSAASASQAVENSPSPLFAYTTGMSAEGGAMPIVRQNYKRSTGKKK